VATRGGASGSAALRARGREQRRCRRGRRRRSRHSREPPALGGATGGGGAGGATASCVTAGKDCATTSKAPDRPAEWKLTKPTGSASITVDSEHVHSGQHAVHIKLVAGQAKHGMLTESVTFPARRTHFTRARSCIHARAADCAGRRLSHGLHPRPGQKRRRRRAAGHRMIGGAKQYLGYSIFFVRPKYEFGPVEATFEPNKWQCIELSKTARAPPKRSAKSGSTAPTSRLRSTSTARARPRPQAARLRRRFVRCLGIPPEPAPSDIWLDDLRVSPLHRLQLNSKSGPESSGRDSSQFRAPSRPHNLPDSRRLRDTV